jgi:hypothetical protein
MNDFSDMPDPFAPKKGFFGIGASKETSDIADFFDMPDPFAPKEESSLIRRGIGDPLVSLAKGTLIGIPETAIGLANIPTMGYAGKGIDVAAKAIFGGGLKEAGEAMDKALLSPETQAAKQKVSEAEGFVPTITTALQNPSAIISTIAESAPSMVGGAGIGRKVMQVAGKSVAEKGISATAKTSRAITAGAIGEGAISAGQNIEQVRQEAEGGTLTPSQVATMTGSGFATGLISRMSGGLAKRLGITDIDTLMQGVNTGASRKGVFGVLRGAIESAITEGAFEELPQSAQEQMAQNIALGKPATEGVANAGAMGLLSGAGMGIMGFGAGRILRKNPVVTALADDPAQLQKNINESLAALSEENAAVNAPIQTMNDAAVDNILGQPAIVPAETATTAKPVAEQTVIPGTEQTPVPQTVSTVQPAAETAAPEIPTVFKNMDIPTLTKYAKTGNVFAKAELAEREKTGVVEPVAAATETATNLQPAAPEQTTIPETANVARGEEVVQSGATEQAITQSEFADKFKGMYKHDPNESVIIQRGKTSATVVPRYVYHQVASRGFSKEGGISPYQYRREAGIGEAVDDAFGQKTDKVIWLSSKKDYGADSVKIDLSKLDPTKLRNTGQGEQNVWYNGEISKDAIVKEMSTEGKGTIAVRAKEARKKSIASIRESWNIDLRHGVVAQPMHTAVNKMLDMAERAGINISNVVNTGKKVSASDIVDFDSPEAIKQLADYGYTKEEIQNAKPEEFKVGGRVRHFIDAHGQRWSSIELFLDAGEKTPWHEFVHAAEKQGINFDKYGANSEQRAINLSKRLAEGEEIPELQGMMGKIAELAKANPNGFTIDISTGEMQTTGYAVSPAKETETRIDVPTKDDVGAFIDRFQSVFETDKRAFLGGWFDSKTNKFVLDVSFVVDSLEDALYIGDIGNQDAIFHLDNQEEIRRADGITKLKETGVYNEGRRSELRGIQESVLAAIRGRGVVQTETGAETGGGTQYSITEPAGRVGTEAEQRVRGKLAEVSGRPSGKVLPGQATISSGIHYSQQERTVLDSSFYGTGKSDAAERRLPADRKSPLWQRIYIYSQLSKNPIHVEPGVGGVRHDVDLSKFKIYDITSGEIQVDRVMGENPNNTAEKAILAAGFDGFANPDYNAVVLLGKRKIDVQPAKPQYSIELPAAVKSVLGTVSSTFTKHQEDIPAAEYKKQVDFFRSQKDFSKLDYALSVPFRFSQKYKEWSGSEFKADNGQIVSGIWKIHGIDRQEMRSDLRANFITSAAPFYEMNKNLKIKGYTKAQIKESESKIERVAFAGDALGKDFTAEELQSGITDEYGKQLKLNPDEIEIYQSIRKSLDNVRNALVNWQSEQTVRGYRKHKWYNMLLAAADVDLNADTIQTLLGEKGLNSAALQRARKIQVDIKSMFDRIETGISEVPLEEAVQAGALYKKVASKMQAEFTNFHNYLGEITGITDKSQLDKLSEDVFAAYLQIRPQLKIIKKLRNEVGKVAGYIPRYREGGNYKIRLMEQQLDEDGNFELDDKGVPIPEKEIHMELGTKGKDTDIIKKIYELYGKDGKLPDNLRIDRKELTTSPEAAFQGVSDTNMQKVFDDAMSAMEGKIGINTTYKDAAGNTINVFDQLREAGYQTIANQFKARGAMRSSIHREQDLVKGYKETGLQATLLNYMSSMAGLMTKQNAAADAMELLSSVKNPSMFNALSKYNKEMLRNDSLADQISGKTRSFAFGWFLGGLLKSAIVNITQNPIVGFSELAKYRREHGLGGFGKADVVYAKAMKDVLVSNLNDLEHADSLTVLQKKFIKKLVSKGVATDQYIQSIFESVTQNDIIKKHLAVMRFLGKPFSMSEIYNRESAGIAMYRTAYGMYLQNALKEGLSEEEAAMQADENTFNDTRTFIDNVHYAYGKANRPLLMMTGDTAGAVMSSMYTFKGFTHNFLARQAELLSQKDFRTVLHTLAYLAMFGGVAGLPFFKDLFEWIEKQFGYSPMNAVRKSLRGIGGETLEKFGISGLPSVLGANISGSIATGLPWPIGANSPEDSIFGVWGGLATKVGRTAQALGRGDFRRAGSEASPEFLRNPSVAARESEIGKTLLGTPGYATNTRGRAMLDENGKPISIGAKEAVLKAVGFNPTDYARSKEKNQTIIRQETWANEAKQEVSERYRIAVINKDPNAVRDMMKNVAEVNKDIRSRGLQTLITPLTVSRVVQNSREVRGKKLAKENAYRQQL